MKRLTTSPRFDGFRMPGEFEKHRGTYIIWPERPDNWRLGAKPAQEVFVKVASVIGNMSLVQWLLVADNILMQEECYLTM